MFSCPYRNELISLFKIDIQYDDERIHPKNYAIHVAQNTFTFAHIYKVQEKPFSIKIPVKRLYTSHTSNYTICHRTPGKNVAPEFYSFSYDPSATEEKPDPVEPKDSSTCSTESACGDHE
jgi:hypothetical protein